MTSRELIADLTGQIREIVQESIAGDESARAWLIKAFPAHTDWFIQIWPPNYLPPSPPSPTVIATLKRGAANKESLALVERIAKRQGRA